MSEAKQLFLKYGGSLFHMDREGEFQRYKSFGVSKKLEDEWIEELRSDFLKRIALETSGVKIRVSIGALIDSTCSRGGYEHVPQMLNLVRSKLSAMDSFSQLMVAESIARLVDACNRTGQAPTIVANALDTATEIIEGILENAITVAPEDQSDALLREVVQPHRIIDRAQQCLLRLRH